MYEIDVYPNHPVDEYWLNKATRERTRMSSEVAAAKPDPPSRDPKKTDTGTKDSKRMRESQSLRTTAQKLAEGDALVPMPSFITAAERAERKAREAREWEERRRLNFAGSYQDEQEMETSGVQQSMEPTPTTSDESMATTTDDHSLWSKRGGHDFSRRRRNCVSRRLEPEFRTTGGRTDHATREFWQSSVLERENPHSQAESRHGDPDDPLASQEMSPRREVHKVYLEKVDAKAPLGLESRDVAETLGRKMQPQQSTPQKEDTVAEAPLRGKLTAINNPPEKVNEVAKAPLGAPRNGQYKSSRVGGRSTTRTTDNRETENEGNPGGDPRARENRGTP
jgi:hypothetical protein